MFNATLVSMFDNTFRTSEKLRNKWTTETAGTEKVNTTHENQLFGEEEESRRSYVEQLLTPVYLCVIHTVAL